MHQEKYSNLKISTKVCVYVYIPADVVEYIYILVACTHFLYYIFYNDIS